MKSLSFNSFIYEQLKDEVFIFSKPYQWSLVYAWGQQIIEQKLKMGLTRSCKT